MRRAVVITGPTASGKSAAALSLAVQCHGEIVNADSMQVYRELDILTARPGPADTALVPHHLYGIADAAVRWSAGTFRQAALVAMAEITARGRLPIIVGGTGLWLKALIEGLSPIPEVPQALMLESQRRLAEIGLPSFRNETTALDRAAEKYDASDRQRLVRAHAVAVHTGVPLSVWQAQPPIPVEGWNFIRTVLLPPREELHRRAAARLATMFRDGAKEEVAALTARNLAADLPAMKAIGVAPIAAALAGEISEQDAQFRVLVQTRQLIKRQTTWIRGQFPDWPRYETATSLEKAVLREFETN